MRKMVESRKNDPNTPRYAVSGFHNKMSGFRGAAATDARRRTCPRRHDKPAELVPKWNVLVLSQKEFLHSLLWRHGKVVILQHKTKADSKFAHKQVGLTAVWHLF